MFTWAGVVFAEIQMLPNTHEQQDCEENPLVVSFGVDARFDCGQMNKTPERFQRLCVLGDDMCDDV